ncbi:MAG TPA: TRAP transporter small permease [Paracoccus sp. (in: a-proteobacteria)]|uniref:TRAP transporter small permease n=1 Tax=uncultured Paracoccus sp. TaxID=189685 RepID=UPI002617AD6D|nr:TRAP transporter small permease [uncultured Paracoccus sp.]HMQ42153.1 TRAP transporter small permease [Paracoccus sp. (in: a-proteobacteria)]HMR37641.1 TRAP transporter small permease [Paracoccus sp. (in: a-proteobacteria)]
MRFLDRFEEIFIILLMAAATILIFVSVTQRYALDMTADLVRASRGWGIEWLSNGARSFYSWMRGLNLVWAQEACIYLFVWMAKFGAAYGVRIGIHVGVDILSERLEGTAKKVVTTIAMSGGIIFTAIVAWFGADFVYHVYLNGQTSPDLEIKMWVVYLAVPLGSALMCFRFIQALYWYLTTGYIAHHDISSVEGVEEEAEVASEGKA